MKLREYAEQKLEALGLEPRQEFELDDGSTITLVHPWLWDDKVQAAVDAAKSSAAIARAILGTEAHKRFVASGGQNSQLVLVTELMKRQISDRRADSDPKDS